MLCNVGNAKDCQFNRTFTLKSAVRTHQKMTTTVFGNITYSGGYDMKSWSGTRNGKPQEILLQLLDLEQLAKLNLMHSLHQSPRLLSARVHTQVCNKNFSSSD